MDGGHEHPPGVAYRHRKPENAGDGLFATGGEPVGSDANQLCFEFGVVDESVMGQARASASSRRSISGSPGQCSVTTSRGVVPIT